MIIAKDISKYYGNSEVLRRVNLHIKKGSIYGLAGRSGAGKSTFLRCINGLEPYDSGSLVVNGTDVQKLSTEVMRRFRKNIGMVFQNFSLLERLSVFENVALPLKCWKYDTSHIVNRTKDLLRLVGLEDKANQKPRNLSGGQKQRVAIARALSMEPEILLCDEATSALDPKTAQEVLRLLQRINHEMGITIVMVTHQMSVLRSVCTEMAILEYGHLDCKGHVDDIFKEQPLALKNLLGELGDISISTSENNVTFSIECDGNLVNKMSSCLGINVTIVNGREDIISASESGLYLRCAESDYETVSTYLNNVQVDYTVN
jgi:D-methionine transport system ATP-binding protein